MGYLDANWTPVPQADTPEDNDLTFMVGSNQFKVIDGDTVKDLSNGQSYRLEGLTAPETAKPIYKDGEVIEYTTGESGGLEAKYNLWEMINTGGFTNVIDLGKQQYGGGEGSRNIARITNDKGEDLAETVYGAGLADIGIQTDERGINAVRDRRIQDALFGESDIDKEYGHLTQKEYAQPTQFKGLALNENWFDPDYYAGVQFRDEDATLYDDKVVDKYGRHLGGGYAVSPISTAWNVGWLNTQNEAGAALEALGVGLGSEALTSWGRTQSGRAGEALSFNPNLPLLNVTDIDGDDYYEVAANTLEWLGVNTAMTLPYMAALAGPALAASALAPVLGGGALVATGLGAVALAPNVALHAGNVWNQVDAENRDELAAGKAFSVGLGLAVIDRLALGAVLNPASLLTREGRNIAYAEIIKQGLAPDLKSAKRVFNQATKEESKDFLKHLGTSGQQYIKKSNILKDSLAAFAVAAPIEAVTEVGQELSAYLTAAQINGDIPDPDEMLHLAINAGAAGGAIGGGFGVGGTFISAGKALADRKAAALLDTGIFNDWAKVHHEQELSKNPDGPQEDRLVKNKMLRDRDPKYDPVEGFTWKLGEQTKRSPVWRENLIDESGNFNVNPIKLIETATHYTGRLVVAPLLNWIKPDDARHNSYIREILGRVTNNRGIGGPGKHFEARNNYLQGVFVNVLNESRIKKLFNLGNRPSKAKDFSITFREFGRKGLYNKMKKLRHQGRRLTDAQLASYKFKRPDPDDPTKSIKYSLTRAQADALFETAQRADTFSDTLYQTELEAIKLDYGKDSKEAKSFGKLPGWWWKHNSVDREKVAKNQTAFTKFVQRKMDAVMNSSTSSESLKKLVSSKTAAERVSDILDRDTGDVFDNFSLVEGVKWGDAKSRTLDMSSDPEFANFATSNVFDTYRAASERTAKRVSHMEYFGDGGRDLDYLFQKAMDREIERGLTKDEAKLKVGRLALSVRDVIDASSSNYNRIQNRKLAGLQQVGVSYLTIVALPLAAFASFPEFAAVFLDVMNSKETGKALRHASVAFVNEMKHIIAGGPPSFVSYSGKKGEVNINTKALKDKKAGNIPDPDQALLERLGIEESSSAIYQKLGVDDSIANNEMMRWVMENFFTVTQIRRTTQLQRRTNAAFAVDFAMTRLNMLASLDPDHKYTNEQGRAFEQLRALGMDVRKMINLLRREPDYTRDALNIALGKADNVATDDYKIIANEMETFIANFVNERIQNPGAANRPLFFQDPHWALLTVFNGFMSTFTANIVPKLWNDNIGKGIRNKYPQMTYSTFGMIMVMIALGGAGQWLKDWLKFGQTNPYLTDTQVYYRASLSSGVIGQYEKVLDLAFPLYTDKGDSVATRAGGTLFGPVGRSVSQIGSGIKQLGPEGSNKQAIKDFLSVVPFFSALPAFREAAGSTLTGKPYNPIEYYDKFK